jgi:hypothetical protein
MWSRLPRWLRGLGLVVAVVALVWVSGLGWNWASNRNDLSARDVEGILSTRVVAARCEPTQRLWSFARDWDYRCELFPRINAGWTAYVPLKKNEPLGAVLVRVDEQLITARRLPNGKVIEDGKVVGG